MIISFILYAHISESQGHIYRKPATGNFSAYWCIKNRLGFDCSEPVLSDCFHFPEVSHRIRISAEVKLSALYTLVLLCRVLPHPKAYRTESSTLPVRISLGIVWCWRSISCFRLLAFLSCMTITPRLILMMPVNVAAPFYPEIQAFQSPWRLQYS